MYNEAGYSTLTEVEPGETWATLARLDGVAAFNFLVNPDSENWTHSSEFAKLPVANTSQPIAKYKYSESALSLPTVRFYSPGNAKNLSGVLAIVTSFTKPIKNGDDPPLLKLTYGDTVIDKCYLRNFTYKTIMKYGGAVNMAEGSMEFILAPDLPKVELAPVEDAKPVIKLTEKELTEASKMVLDAFTNNPKLAQQYKTNPAKDKYGVSSDLKVSINDKVVGTLSQILGDKIPAKWSTPKMA